MDEDLTDLSDQANLRVAFPTWPKGTPHPPDVQSVAMASLSMLAEELLLGSGAPITVVRFARDGLSIWRLDALAHITIEDFVRACARAFEPHAYAIAVVQPMRRAGDARVAGLHCRAAFGDDFIEVQGDAVQPAIDALPVVPSWTARRGQARTDAARWIGVPPTTWIALPMISRHDA